MKIWLLDLEAIWLPWQPPVAGVACLESSPREIPVGTLGFYMHRDFPQHCFCLERGIWRVLSPKPFCAESTYGQVYKGQWGKTVTGRISAQEISLAVMGYLTEAVNLAHLVPDQYKIKIETWHVVAMATALAVLFSGQWAIPYNCLCATRRTVYIMPGHPPHCLGSHKPWPEFSPLGEVKKNPSCSRPGARCRCLSVLVI